MLAQFYLFFFFIFPGTVLPFCYFSVVRKVPEKPVLFLPHPLIFSSLRSEVSKKVCHILVGQKLMKDMYFLEKGVFSPVEPSNITMFSSNIGTVHKTSITNVKLIMYLFIYSTYIITRCNDESRSDF